MRVERASYLMEVTMSDVLVYRDARAAAVEPGVLIAAACERWTSAVFVPEEGDLSSSTHGQLQLTSAQGTVLVELLASTGGLNVQGDDESVAEFLVWLSHWPGLPPGWMAWPSQSPEPLPLSPGLTALQVLDSER
ncbi:hypothetical protein [Actinotalea sp. K2]|uniref:hypothetical protein n=1 Tax=Actinotalea sp. K2 TaxID=2939438 RepID=UPI002017A3BE|nr:hypothetical protein [Actinotalea sp. K2]MCL3861793.1 hypothetical protein [Actinotalea sp. K2]